MKVSIGESEQPIRYQRNFYVLRAQSMRKLALVAIQQGYPKDETKSFHSGYLY